MGLFCVIVSSLFIELIADNCTRLHQIRQGMLKDYMWNQSVDVCHVFDDNKVHEMECECWHLLLTWHVPRSVLQRCRTTWTKWIVWSVWCSTCLLQTMTHCSSCVSISNGESETTYSLLMCLFSPLLVFSHLSVLKGPHFIMQNISWGYSDMKEWTRCHWKENKISFS